MMHSNVCFVVLVPESSPMRNSIDPLAEQTKLDSKG